MTCKYCSDFNENHAQIVMPVKVAQIVMGVKVVENLNH